MTPGASFVFIAIVSVSACIIVNIIIVVVIVIVVVIFTVSSFITTHPASLLHSAGDVVLVYRRRAG